MPGSIDRPRQAEVFALVMAQLVKDNPAAASDWKLKEDVVLAIIELGCPGERDNEELARVVIALSRVFRAK